MRSQALARIILSRVAVVAAGGFLIYSALSLVPNRPSQPRLEKNVQRVQLQEWETSLPYNKTSPAADNGSNEFPETGDRSRRYLTIYPLDGSAGRLGNFCFRYAAAQAIATSNKMTLILPDTDLVRAMKSYFNLRAPLSSEIKNWDRLPFINISEKHWGIYDSMLIQSVPPPTNVRLFWAYTQSWKYFYNIRESIREELTFNQPLAAKAASTVTQLKGDYNASLAVGLHVRRGDFLNPIFQNWGYAVAPADYFSLAIKWFIEKYGPNILFIVAAQAEDMPWSHENLNFNGAKSYFSTGRSAVDDFTLLTACDHHIVSVGSFGWWASWLGKGNTVYYKLWPRPGSNHAKNHSPVDYYLPDWTPLP